MWTGKADIKKAGLPEAVINDLNKAVRVGLLLPAFKYAERVAFLNHNHRGSHILCYDMDGYDMDGYTHPL